MPFHRLPFELYSTILKLAVNLWVEDYGPSEAECTCADTCTNGECLYVPAGHPCRVSEVLGQLRMPDLACAFCDRICRKRLSRTECGMVEWRAVCEACDLGCEE
jgi:hypothetical protein